LDQVRCATADIASNEVRIRFRKISRTHFVAGENAIAKAGRESLNLRFDLIRHIRTAVEWNMAIRPKRVLITRCARFIEETLLRDQHERALRNFSARNLALRCRAFVNAATEMNRSRTATCFGFPWDGLAQGIINLKNPRRVSE